ncbi:MAG: NfeD family protein [Desulfurococcaceae archaeon]
MTSKISAFLVPAMLIIVQILLASDILTCSVVDLEMNIDGGAVIFIERAISQYGDGAIVFKINSYGGYLVAADKIISIIMEKNITCFVWIPPGGYAISAAALISLACKEIYMGPGSVIGGIKPSPEDVKVMEYVMAKLRALLENKGLKNVEELVRELVVNARTFTAEEAEHVGLAKKASSLEEMASLERLYIARVLEPNLWERMISVLSNPIVSEVILIASILLILVEVFTTGFQGYVIAGVILMLLALYSMAIIPVDILHLALAISGLILLAIEIYTPGFGVFGIVGLILMIAGLALTASRQPPEVMTGPVYAIIGGISALAGLVIYIAFSAAKTARLKRRSIDDVLRESIGVAKTDLRETEPGGVYIAGEEWTAYSNRGFIPAGSKVRVVKREGLRLLVEKID